MKRRLAFLALLVLYLLHFDFWLWERSDLVLGLPIGLLYHFVYCLLVTAVLSLIVFTADRRTSTS